MSRLDRWRRPSGSGINRYEHRVYSQHREDGIIQYILAQIPSPSHRFVEFGFGPAQSNCLNLALDGDYEGLFLDGNQTKVTLAQQCYQSLCGDRVKVAEAFLTCESINQVIESNGFSGEIDVLSIDVDGNDYWFWQSLDVVDPMLVVIEYNASLGHDRSITVPYDADFIRYEKHSSGFYHGASLAALNHLAIGRGYRLIGCDSSGVNAFFVKQSLAEERLSTLSPEEAFFPHRSRTRYKKLDQSEQFSPIADMPFVEITAEKF